MAMIETLLVVQSSNSRRHAVLYVADWHRIRLISDDDDVLSAVEGMREPGSLTEQKEIVVLQAFIKEIGRKGLGDA